MLLISALRSMTGVKNSTKKVPSSKLMAAADGKPRALVLGGTGFIGRNMVKFLVEGDHCSMVRAVDKKPPATAFFSEEFKGVFANPVVNFVQANLNAEAGVAKAFALEGDAKFDLVFNFAAETAMGQEDAVYQSHVVGISAKTSAEAAKQGVRRFVEISTSQVYEPKGKPSKEDSKTKPWTSLAKAKLQAEQALASVTGLQYNILRPAVVYGPADASGVMPRMICGAVYKHLNEKYNVLWGGDLKCNTVHVLDVCRAAWHVATQAPPGTTFNLADKGNTDQAKMNTILEQIFGIKTGFVGTIMSNMAKMSMSTAKSFANEKHMEPWGEMCKASNILNTPLTPYISEELLTDNHNCVDGSAIEATGFAYTVPELTEAGVRECIDQYIRMGLFPPSAL